MPDAWEINDVFGLEPELLTMLPQPVLGLMLLFPITSQHREHCQAHPPSSPLPPSLYYMKQTVSNACGTVALLHLLANGRSSGRLLLPPSSPLEAFLSSTSALSPQERAAALECDEAIVRCHDAAAKEGQTAPPALDEKVDLHYVALVEADGQVWELDGRREGAVASGSCGEGEFLEKAAGVCKGYMGRGEGSLQFTVLALTARMD